MLILEHASACDDGVLALPRRTTADGRTKHKYALGWSATGEAIRILRVPVARTALSAWRRSGLYGVVLSHTLGFPPSPPSRRWVNPGRGNGNPTVSGAVGAGLVPARRRAPTRGAPTSIAAPETEALQGVKENPCLFPGIEYNVQQVSCISSYGPGPLFREYRSGLGSEWGSAG